MVFQSYALYPHMSIYDNMAFGLKLRKVPKAQIDERVKDAARILNLENLQKKPRELSGGQRQRVALGRAIVREPAVFLMDEPLSNLDAKLRVQTRAEIARLHQRLGTTTVYVTHDQVEAMTMGTRIAVMDKGELHAGRAAPGAVRQPEEAVRGRVHRQPGDELRERQAATATGRRARASRCRSRPATAAASRAPRTSSPASGRSTSSSATSRTRRRSGRRPTSSSSSATRSCSTSRVQGHEGDVVAVVSSEHRVKPGDVLDLKLPLEKLHLFDAASGDAVAWSMTEAAA